MLDNLPEGGEPAQDLDLGEAPQEPQQAQQELILGKFRTVDDLIRSYQELERAFHETRAQLRQSLSTEEAPTQPVGTSEEATVSSEEFFGEFADRPVETVRKVVEPLLDSRLEEVWQVLPQAIQMSIEAATAWQQLLAEHPDAEKYEQRMTALSVLVPQMLEQGQSMRDIVRQLYAMARAPEASASVEQEERARIRQQMLGTVVEQGGPSGVAPAQVGPAQRVIQEIVQFAGRPALRPVE